MSSSNKREIWDELAKLTSMLRMPLMAKYSLDSQKGNYYHYSVTYDRKLPSGRRGFE
jgi:hypothetical protein